MRPKNWFLLTLALTLIFLRQVEANDLINGCSGSGLNPSNAYSISLTQDYTTALDPSSLLPGTNVDRDSNIPEVAHQLFGVQKDHQLKIGEVDLIINRYDQPTPPRVRAFAECIKPSYSEVFGSLDGAIIGFRRAPINAGSALFSEIVRCVRKKLPAKELPSLKEAGLHSPPENCDQQCVKGLREGLLKFLPTPKRSAPEALKFVMGKLRDQVKKKGGHFVMAAYSGHGVRCRGDFEIDVCLGVPDFYSALQDSPSASLSKLKLWDEGEWVESNMPGREYLRGREWITASGAQRHILDACFSGQAVAEAQDNPDLSTSLMLIASSLRGQTSRDTDKGGLLLQRLKELSDKGSKTVCELDFEGNGKVSERALGAYVLSRFMSDSSPLGSMTSAALRQRVQTEAVRGAKPEEVQRSKNQLPESLLSNRCVFTLAKGACPKSIAPAQPNATVCEKYRSKVERTAVGLSSLFKARPNMTTEGGKVRAPKLDLVRRIEGQTPPASDPNAKWVKDEQRKAATSFVSKWIADLALEGKSCMSSRRAADRCDQEKATARLKQTEKWITELTEVIQYFEAHAR